jgi:hypothetical protein
VLQLSVTCLSERVSEILPVFLDNYLTRSSIDKESTVFISIEAIALLLQRPYEKNFRELRNMAIKLRDLLKPSTSRDIPIRKRDILAAFDITLDKTSRKGMNGSRSYDLTNDTSAVIELSLEVKEKFILSLEQDTNWGKGHEFQVVQNQYTDFSNNLAICGNHEDPFARVVCGLVKIKESLIGSSASKHQTSTNEMIDAFEKGISEHDIVFNAAICDDALFGLQMLFVKAKSKNNSLDFFYEILTGVLRKSPETTVTKEFYEQCAQSRRLQMTQQQSTDIYNSFKKEDFGGTAPKKFFRKCAFFLMTGNWPPED